MSTVKDLPKHNVFVGDYYIDEEGAMKPSEVSEWVVQKYEGEGVYSNLELEDTEGMVCMILMDGEREFWPVMSLLEPEEARALGFELINRAGAIQEQKRR